MSAKLPNIAGSGMLAKVRERELAGIVDPLRRAELAAAILLTDKELAALLSMSVSGVQRLKLPRCRIGRRCVRTPLSAALEFLSRRIVQGRTQRTTTNRNIKTETPNGYELL